MNQPPPKKTKAADDFAKRMLATYSKQTDALERIATARENADVRDVRIAALLERIANQLTQVTTVLATVAKQQRRARQTKRGEPVTSAPAADWDIEVTDMKPK